MIVTAAAAAAPATIAHIGKNDTKVLPASLPQRGRFDSNDAGSGLSFHRWEHRRDPLNRTA